MAFLFEQVNVRDCSSTYDMVTLIDESLSQEFFNVLQILLVNDFGKYSESIGLEQIIICELNILGEATDDDEDFIFIDIKLFDQDIN